MKKERFFWIILIFGILSILFAIAVLQIPPSAFEEHPTLVLVAYIIDMLLAVAFGIVVFGTEYN